MKQEQTQEPDVVLSPEVAAHLAPYVDTLLELKTQEALLKEQIDIEKARVWAEMQLFDVKKAVIGGYAFNEIKGYTSKLNKEEFVLRGGDLKLLNNCTYKKPKKAYLEVRKAGEQKPEEGNEE